MISKLCFWLKNSRIFSLPMSFMSWLIIFIYSLKFNGNIINGLIALIGISFAHLATNLFDDYCDFSALSEKSQQCKCAYILDGSSSLSDVLKVVIIYLIIAFICGLILTLRCGYPIIFLAIIGGLVTLLYAKFSQRGLSEVAVGIAFGPLLFEGVYYVMTKNFSFTVLIMSIAVVMFTIGLMYVHSILDYEGDVASHKMTLCCRIGDKNKAILGVWVIYIVAYFFTGILIYLIKNPFLFLSFILIPLVFDMCDSLKSYTCGGDIKEFYYRLLKARNLMVYYSVIFCVSLLLG